MEPEDHPEEPGGAFGNDQVHPDQLRHHRLGHHLRHPHQASSGRLPGGLQRRDQRGHEGGAASGDDVRQLCRRQKGGRCFRQCYLAFVFKTLPP